MVGVTTAVCITKCTLSITVIAKVKIRAVLWKYIFRMSEKEKC